MLTQVAREYIHSNSVGNLKLCKEAIQETEELLEPLYEEKNILGYQLLLIESSLDAEYHLLEGQFEAFTKGPLPFVCSFIQPTENSDFDFDRLMKELHYIRVNV
ncbi:hypothetical protein IC235_09380 [Hymenobacter sp. BT664]|uniref:Uncharacterized protein n=1 Tax=Hymenobacter montanus TaxID=2771359 RepID=A0A927GJ69_9BACT|nr:hypothetical protein [Hymenobacter montanus]MBD2768100.1 hypothetical protein [Hymenobacter montanus]